MKREHAVCPLTKGERILVAVDGSIYSDKALDQAISMAKVCNSTLFAVTVVEFYPSTLGLAPEFREKMEKEAWEILERVKHKAAEENISCEPIVHIGGSAHEYIVQEAKERGVDLIVMGTHGRTGLKKLLMGSVAERVVGHAPCAVLVTPV